jgi:hypothetical protein
MHAGTFTATCTLGLATFSLTSCSSFPWLLPTFVPPPAPWDANKRQDYFADHNCPGYAFRAICFETFGQLSPGAMQLWFFF